MSVWTSLVPLVGVGCCAEGLEEGKGLECAFKVGGVGEGGGGIRVGGRTGCGTGCDEGKVWVGNERAGGVGTERDRADEEERTEETGPGLAWMNSGEETGRAGNTSKGVHLYQHCAGG